MTIKELDEKLSKFSEELDVLFHHSESEVSYSLLSDDDNE